MATPKTKIKRKGSGRTHGSFSFVLIPLSQLNAKFADQTTPIKVSRLFAQQMGFTGLTSAPAGVISHQIEGKTPDTAVEVKVRDLNTESE